jgi:hypothetical protein
MKKTRCRITDTYDDFLGYWRNARFEDVDRQIELWRTSYMEKYPELLTKQLKNYEGMSIDWRDFAKRIFLKIPARLELMGGPGILNLY